MKKILTALTAAIIGVTILATPAQATPQDDRLFYSLVTTDAPTLKTVGRKQLIKAARATCKYLRAGNTIMGAYNIMEDTGFTDNEITSLLAGAVVFYCPDQQDNF